MKNTEDIQPTLPSVGFVRLTTVLAVFPVSVAIWYEGVNEGIYPKPVKLGPRSVGWRVEDIRELLERVNSEEYRQQAAAVAAERASRRRQRKQQKADLNGAA